MWQQNDILTIAYWIEFGCSSPSSSMASPSPRCSFRWRAMCSLSSSTVWPLKVQDDHSHCTDTLGFFVFPMITDSSRWCPRHLVGTRGQEVKGAARAHLGVTQCLLKEDLNTMHIDAYRGLASHQNVSWRVYRGLTSHRSISRLDVPPHSRASEDVRVIVEYRDRTKSTYVVHRRDRLPVHRFVFNPFSRAL